jgi:hypothetical protein
MQPTARLSSTDLLEGEGMWGKTRPSHLAPLPTSVVWEKSHPQLSLRILMVVATSQRVADSKLFEEQRDVVPSSSSHHPVSQTGPWG